MRIEPNENQANDAEFVASLTDVQPSLFLFVRSLMPGESTATDVAQQTNSKIWEKRREFEPGTNFKAWAFSIARYEVLNFRKQQVRDRRLFFSDELENTITEELSQENDASLNHDALKHCLSKLKTSDQDLIMHRYASKGTLAEFATQVGQSTGGLRVKLHRLRNTLLECIHRTVANHGAAG